MKLLREPSVHFLLLGAVLFGVFALVGDRAFLQQHADAFPFGQKTQTHHFHRAYEPTLARSTSCIPSGYVPYSPPLRDNDFDGMPHGLETTARLYHQFRR